MVMAYDTQYMPSVGRDKAVTAEQIFEMMDGSDRPAWSAKDIGDYFDVSTPTAKDRLNELEEDGWVESTQVSNVTAYSVAETENLDLVERHKQSLVHDFTDKFVGLETAPWTAVHPNDGPAEAGDKVQIRVEGEPGRWRQQMTHTWDSRREELIYEETAEDETQALISGELYAKPTTPIEHTDYPDDYDLELNIGAEVIKEDGRTAIIAAGVKNYLIRPCNDAVFLTNVSVDWMSPKGHGQQVETYEITPEMVETIEEKRKEIAEELDETDVGEEDDVAQPGVGWLEKMLDTGEPVDPWLRNGIERGTITLDEETVDLLLTHENSPVDSEAELREVAEEAGEEWEPRGDDGE